MPHPSMASWAFVATVLALAGCRRAPQAEKAPRPSAAWRHVDVSSPLAKAADVAVGRAGWLSTDGASATVDLGAGPRALDVSLPIHRVFAAGARLFALGGGETPLLIVLSRAAEPAVVPVPCPLAALAGAAEAVVGACAGGDAVAFSADGGKSFGKVPLPALPETGAGTDAKVERTLDAVATDASGAAAVVLSQRWPEEVAGERWLWSVGHLGVREGKGFRFLHVPGLVKAFGLRIAGPELEVAGLELAPEHDGEDRLRPRIWRGTALGGLEPAGSSGPPCLRPLDAGRVQGLALGPSQAVLLCGERLVSTFDGGNVWWEEALPGAMTTLRGGEMRLWGRGPAGAWQRRFLQRSSTGAVAAFVGPAAAVEPGAPLAVLPAVQEPSVDGGGVTAE